MVAVLFMVTKIVLLLIVELLLVVGEVERC